MKCPTCRQPGMEERPPSLVRTSPTDEGASWLFWCPTCDTYHYQRHNWAMQASVSGKAFRSMIAALKPHP